LKTGEKRPACEVFDRLRDKSGTLVLGGDGLVWLDDMGIGYLPKFEPNIYDAAYWEKYVRMAETEMGAALTKARVEFVSKFQLACSGTMVDVGIGAGQFVSAFPAPQCLGYDINPVAERWLRDRGLWINPWEQQVDTACFFDALEHIPEPGPLLSNVRRYVFVSIPVVPDGQRPGPGWRHYRPGEHLLYFTRAGIIRFMLEHGFRCVGEDDFETRLGRLDIRTFAFARLSAASA
jgi:SAM-dependent methyltransferase